MNKSKNQKNEKSVGFVGNVFTKVILRIVTIACIVVVVFFGGKYLFGKLFEAQIEKKHTMVEMELSESSELTLYKMRYSDIVSIKKKQVMSRAYSFVRYSGIIRAGIEDISQSEILISDDGKVLTVKVPPSKVLGNDIYSQEVFDEKQGFFAKITTQEVFDEINAAKEDALMEILEEGLLDDADARAAYVIKHLLAPIGFEKIIVELK